ncbi:hypothetical protein OIU74_006140 [Salix koriyanagi]|uniref:Uncharacterized protein n=1 Tax=Salix koriyanagi TaxID=2511006 RepID=A0A9Q0UDH6_9ROSI|nr:hypothetical protein OIU74_006140 [Salix koriyanagi]
MEMEDWIESMREGELIVIDEAGGSTISQGQGEDLSDTENLTESITVEGYKLINQGRVSSEGKETEVSGVGVGDLTDEFIMVADESLKRFEKQINLGRDTCSLKEIKAILWTIGQMWRRNKASGENTVKGIKRSF